MKENQDFNKLSPGSSKNSLNIVFFGTSEFAIPALKYLVQNGYHIAGVFTQPEKPVGRAKVIMPSPVKKAALELNIPVFEPHNLKNEEALKEFKHLNPNLCVVASYGKIIPVQYLELPKYGFLNIHPSLLPKYRGPSPIQTSIMNGDSETGATIIIVDEEMDHGQILSSIKYQLAKDKYYQQIEEELAEKGTKLLLEILPKYIDRAIELKEQEHTRATFTKKLERFDGKIDWNRTADEIYNQIRALNFEPGTWTEWKGKVLNIKAAEVLDLKAEFPSGIVRKINNNVAVTTKKCYLILKQIQLEGGKEMDAKAFVNGHPDFLGSVLE